MKTFTLIFSFGFTAWTSGLGLDQPFEADRDTLALWHLDEGIGQEVKDAAGFGADGVLQTNEKEGGQLPEWVEGRFGKALRFHGNWDVVQMKKVESLKIDGPFTIEAWVKLANPKKNAGAIIGNKSETSEGFKLSYTVWKEYHGFVFIVTQNGQKHVADCRPQIEPDTWCYVAAVFDGKRADLYVNGARVTRDATTEAVTTKNVNWPIFLGGYHPSFNRSFLGVIDEVRISGVARRLAP